MTTVAPSQPQPIPPPLSRVLAEQLGQPAERAKQDVAKEEAAKPRPPAGTGTMIDVSA